MPLALPVTVVMPGFVNVGLKRGSEVTEPGGGGGGGGEGVWHIWGGGDDTPSHGRDILKFRVSKCSFFYSPFSIFKISQCENLGRNLAKFGQNSRTNSGKYLFLFYFLLVVRIYYREFKEPACTPMPILEYKKSLGEKIVIK